MSVRRDLYLKAVETAALLNTVEDDDERALLHGVFEQHLAHELDLGEVNRRVAREMIARGLMRGSRKVT